MRCKPMILTAGAAVIALVGGGVWWWSETSSTTDLWWSDARSATPSVICPATVVGATATPALQEPSGGLLLTHENGLFSARGRPLQARVGQQIVVRLDSSNLGGWTPLQLTGDAVDIVNSTGGYVYPCPASPLIVHLRARKPGTSTLTSFTDLACFHAHPACLPPAEQWMVTIDAVA